MKELGIIVRWGRVIPGREKEAVEGFTEATKYFGDLLAKGWLTYFEPFGYLSGDNDLENGFFLMKGPAEKVHEIFESEPTLRLKTQATMYLDHLTIEFLLVGDEVINNISRFAEIAMVPVGA